MNKFALLLPLALMSLSGCTAVLAGAGIVAADQYINEEDTNFAAQNYAVADFLIQQADTFIGPRSLVLAEPLTDIQAPEISTTIAKLIPEQIGIRLSQLGYRMDLTKVTTSADTNYLRPSVEPNEKPDFILTGNYLRRNSRDVDVKTRIIDLKNNRIVAVFDYQIEISRSARDLSKPKPKIIRTTQTQ